MSQEDFSDAAAEPTGDLESEMMVSEEAMVEEPQVQAPPPPKPEPPAQKPPSRASRIFRKVMLYLIGILIMFMLGFIAAWYFQVIPARQAAEEAQTMVVEEIEQLEAQILEDELHFHLLNALVDVYSAQVAIGQEDAAGVRAALAGTDDRLAMVEETLEDDSASAIAALRTQLQTVIGTIDDDLDAANTGLERLASNLLAFERSMYGE